MEPQPLPHGKLISSGRPWHIVQCARPDSHIKEGRHLILEMTEQLTAKELTVEELEELCKMTFNMAQELASEPDRWRVDFNGPALVTRKHWHAHIKLPAGADELARLVG